MAFFNWKLILIEEKIISIFNIFQVLNSILFILWKLDYYCTHCYKKETCRQKGVNANCSLIYMWAPSKKVGTKFKFSKFQTL